MEKAIFIIFILISFLITSPCAAVEKPGVEKFAAEFTARGWRYFNIGDIDTALKKFRQSIILDPEFSDGYYSIGYIYSIKNRFTLATQYYRKSIELSDPPTTLAYMNLGLALMMSGKNQKGLRCSKRR